MTKKAEKERPAAKDRTVSVRVPPDVYDAAVDKAAGRKSTLSKIIRAFLVMFANDETPEGWPPEIPEQEVRAEKRPRKKK